MKRTSVIVLAVLLGSLAVAVSSCKKNDSSKDTEKPVIEIHEPEENEYVLVGKGMHLEMDLSDNEALASYKINVHNAFDGHSHSSTAPTRHEGEEKKPFAYEKIHNEITGQKNAHVHTHEVVIPADAHLGAYHLMVYCTDKAGNESWRAVKINVTDDASKVEDHDHHKE